MTATLCSIVLFLGFCGDQHAKRVGCCDLCGVETAKVQYELQRLHADPRWRQRDNAAHELRKFDWHCHPEILSSLVQAMLSDCEEEVREEAAETLAKLAPCVPEVHAALAKAANCDPDHATRKWARRGLDRLKTRCGAACSICGPVPTEFVAGHGKTVISPPAPSPTVYIEPLPTAPSSDPLLELPPLQPIPPSETIPAPSTTVPPLPPSDTGPFLVPPSAEKPRADRLAEKSKADQKPEKSETRRETSGRPRGPFPLIKRLTDRRGSR